MQSPRPGAPFARRVFLAVVLIGTAGCTADTRFSQAQLDAIQTRQLDVAADRAYRAVIGALLEQHYHIGESDMEGGLLVATSFSGDEWRGYERSTIQIAVQPTGPSSTSVRISTSSDGQTRVDEDRIKRLHARIDVHAHTPVTEVLWETMP